MRQEVASFHGIRFALAVAVALTFASVDRSSAAEPPSDDPRVTVHRGLDEHPGSQVHLDCFATAAGSATAASACGDPSVSIARGLDAHPGSQVNRDYVDPEALRIFRQLVDTSKFDPFAPARPIRPARLAVDVDVEEIRIQLLRASLIKLHRAGFGDRSLIRTHRAGVSEQARITVHRAGVSDQRRIIVHRAGSSDQSLIRTYTSLDRQCPCGRIKVHRAGIPDNSLIRVIR